MPDSGSADSAQEQLDGYACHVQVLPGAVGWIVGAESLPCDLPGMERMTVGVAAPTAPVRGQACFCPWRA
jgi:hypothetical protein